MRTDRAVGALFCILTDARSLRPKSRGARRRACDNCIESIETNSRSRGGKFCERCRISRSALRFCSGNCPGYSLKWRHSNRAQTKPPSASSQSKKPATTPANTPAPAPNSPVSTHYPDPAPRLRRRPKARSPAGASASASKVPSAWIAPTIRPSPSNQSTSTRDGSNDAWTYRAKDSATGADVSVHLTRENCSPANEPAAKYTFRAIAQHGQIGTLNGCARIAAELFPKINNQPDPDDEDKIPAVLPADVIKFQLPTAIAYIAGTKVAVGARQNSQSRRARRQRAVPLSRRQKTPLHAPRQQNRSRPHHRPLRHDNRPLTRSRPRRSARSLLVSRRCARRVSEFSGSEVAALHFHRWHRTAARHARLHRQPHFPPRLGRRSHAARQRHAKRLLDHRRRPHNANRSPERNLRRHFDITGSDTFRVNPINPDLAPRRRALRQSPRRRAHRPDGPRRRNFPL